MISQAAHRPKGLRVSRTTTAPLPLERIFRCQQGLKFGFGIHKLFEEHRIVADTSKTAYSAEIGTLHLEGCKAALAK